MTGKAAKQVLRAALLRTPLPVRSHIEVGLLRGYEAYLRGQGNGGRQFAGGHPVPPAKLRVLVSGTADADYFLDTGRRQAELLKRIFERNGASLHQSTAMLDFGCGCGRVTRWLADLEGPALYGCDPQRELVQWTRANLPFVNATVSEADPPLPYPAGTFDAIWALSVFTHLPERRALAWMTELRRVLRPGGLLLFTVAGEAYRDQLSATDAARYERAQEIVQFGSAAGTNLCIAYHSPAYVRATMLAGYELVEAFLTPDHPQESEMARMPQDCYLVRALTAGAYPP